PVPFDGEFTNWLRAVIARRRAHTPEQVEADVRAGLAESLRRGVALIGDISALGSSWDVLAAGPGRAVVFYELLGLTAERADQSLVAARAWLGAHPATPGCRPGLSPHAPYSVRSDLFGRAGVLAHEFRVPVAVHVAETLAELELLSHRRGPFIPFLKELGVWDPDGLARSEGQVMAAVDSLTLKLFVHCNHLAPS